MRRHLAALVLLIVAGALGAGAPAAAQPLCPRAYCVALPVVHTPLPAFLVGSEVRYYLLGHLPIGLLYAQFGSSTGAPVCDVVVDYLVDKPVGADEAGTVTIPVVMPDEIEWRSLAQEPEPGSSLRIAVRSWRIASCDYVRLTALELRGTALDYSLTQIEGSIRNDTPVTVRSPRVRLYPGHAFRHHYDFTLEGVTLEPGATATYSQMMTGMWYSTAFSASAIGLAP
jgi:hypothetical protein